MAFSLFYNKKEKFLSSQRGSADPVAQDIFIVVGAVVFIVLIFLFIQHTSSLNFEVKYSQDEDPVFDDLGRLRTDIKMDVSREEALNFWHIGLLSGAGVIIVFVFVFGLLIWPKHSKKKRKIYQKEAFEENENSPPGIS